MSADSPLAAAAAETARRRTNWRNAQIGRGWLIVSPAPAPLASTLLHEGGTSGLRSFAAVIPEFDAAAVMLTDHARSVSRRGLRVMDALIGESQQHRRLGEVAGCTAARGRTSDREKVRAAAGRTPARPGRHARSRC